MTTMRVVAIIPNRGRIESDALNRALLEMASRGERTHCSDVGLAGLWLSEHEADRQEACRLCIGCPVQTECLTAATTNQERFGV
jgi:hypothetical protein